VYAQSKSTQELVSRLRPAERSQADDGRHQPVRRMRVIACDRRTSRWLTVRFRQATQIVPGEVGAAAVETLRQCHEGDHNVEGIALIDLVRQTSKLAAWFQGLH